MEMTFTFDRDFNPNHKEYFYLKLLGLKAPELMTTRAAAELLELPHRQIVQAIANRWLVLTPVIRIDDLAEYMCKNWKGVRRFRDLVTETPLDLTPEQFDCIVKVAQRKCSRYFDACFDELMLARAIAARVPDTGSEDWLRTVEEVADKLLAHMDSF